MTHVQGIKRAAAYCRTSPRTLSTAAAYISDYPRSRSYTNENSIYSMEIEDVDGYFRNVNYLDTGGDLEPLIILGGTAQTINTWRPHIRPLMSKNRVIMPELRCQGIDTDLLTHRATIKQHLLDIEIIMENLGVDQAHFLGFSFGGRIAVALAAHRPKYVKKLSITAVPLHRNLLGVAVLRSWKEGLLAGNLRECAWSFLLNGYSEAFLERNFQRLPQYVDAICESNCARRLYDLINSCHMDEDIDDKYSVAKCIPKIKCAVQVIASSTDRIASLQSVKDLYHAILDSCDEAMTEEIRTAKTHSVLDIIENSGHLIPFEQPVRWRKHVMEFLNN
eukprot:CAMPEP_0182424680 /NCGR_PEP_ID=MMETSP1167-20130531/10914_1 /TAXON_ID=2988 /ORGANISM="Mallomonas Sp, Strain CCMP3275" /LENGTH=333 /DNA_ID=CAMNT_0024604667 /DNA_START=74 /DNA_END=1075 /DNA_ORIENTATION=-